MTQSTLFTVATGACPTYDADQPAYSPFQNLEVQRLKNACLSSRETQRAYDESAKMAHTICLWYWASKENDYPVLAEVDGLITREGAIELLQRYCRRSREQAIINLDRSRYAVASNRCLREYGVSVAENLRKIGVLAVALNGED